MKRLAAVALLGLVAAACSSTDQADGTLPEANLPQTAPTTTGPITSALSTFTGDELGFTISYPSSWATTVDDQARFVGFVSRPAGDNFIENFNVAVTDVPEGANLDGYADINLSGYQTNLDDFQLVGLGEITLGGLPARSHAFHATQDGIPLGFLRVIALDGTTGYEFTFIASINEFGPYLPLMETILNSFELTGGSQ